MATNSTFPLSSGSPAQIGQSDKAFPCSAVEHRALSDLLEAAEALTDSLFADGAECEHCGLHMNHDDNADCGKLEAAIAKARQE